MDDVYAGLTELLRPAERGQAPGGWLFGQVQQAGQGTLRVVCGGLTLDQTELHVPPGLDYAWTEDTGGDELLRAGDRLLVLVTADGQDYYILQTAVFSCGSAFPFSRRLLQRGRPRRCPSIGT